MAVWLPWLPQDPSPAETHIAEPVEACAAAEQAEINEEAAAEPTGEVTPLASRDESRENTLQGKTEGRLKEIWGKNSLSFSFFLDRINLDWNLELFGGK